MYLYVVTKIFTWFIGWNGMRLRMNEERMVEGALQLALYAFILFLYWLIQMIALIILLTFIANANPQSPNSNGPTDLAMIELNNFVRCGYGYRQGALSNCRSRHSNAPTDDHCTGPGINNDPSGRFSRYYI